MTREHMITPIDEDYKHTKRIKRGEITIESPLRELADWISTKYLVQVLNIYCDTINREKLPRLNVVTESEQDAGKFREGPFGNYREDRQMEVGDQYFKLMSQHNEHRLTDKRLLVIFTAFEPIARIEANQQVSSRQISQFKKKLANPELWEIRNFFDSITFFFYTDDQANASELIGLRELYSAEYARLVEPYDEFGYLKKRAVPAYFDSKQNFDTNYESSWYYYYK